VSYDCIIIGGGLAGLTCGIKCAKEGLRTVILSGGMSALHFSSGSIDLFGYNQRGRIITDPFEFLKDFISGGGDHPYVKTGTKVIHEAMDFFTEEVQRENLNLYNNGNNNHFHITALGTLKPTYLSQASVFSKKIKEAFERKGKIAVLEFDGFRDYYSALGIENLKKHPMFRDIEIIGGKITMPHYLRTEKNLHEFRSIDLARVFETEKYLPRLADEIKKQAGNAEIVGLPAFIGITNSTHIHRRLQEMTGLIIYEVPTLPPSLLGMRLDTALRSRFAAHGGEYSASSKVVSGVIDENRVSHVFTENYGDTKYRARTYLLSTGSFFSGGLRSGFNHMEEPVFRLKFSKPEARNKWYSKDFFDKKGHRFLEYGVETNKSLNPLDENGKTVKNLFCAGALLAGYNPIREGSGGGVAISTGYQAALKIIKECRS
jgi:glycerol-3-phosphate dehydrogenase subunit B